MQDNQDYILNICQDLHKKGKNPSVALIRSHADRPLMIPQIIKVLQNWKQNPKLGANNTGIPLRPSNEREDTGQRQSLEQRVADLEQKVRDMSKQLSTLKKSTLQG